MQKLKATWFPSWTKPITGLNQELGHFYLTFVDEHIEGSIGINLTIPKDPERYKSVDGFFASLSIHSDGIELLGEMADFLAIFGKKRACTFYDVFDCLHSSGFVVVSHDDDPELMANRMWYDLVHGDGKKNLEAIDGIAR